SGGTAATSTRIAMSPAVTFRDGELRTERTAARVGTFEVEGRRLRGVSLGGSEHFALPRAHASLRTVDVYLGRMAGGARATQALSAVSAGAFKIPGVRSAVTALAGRLLKGSTGGPDAEARSRTAFLAVARAATDSGRVLASVALHGPDVYTFTGDILAWGAMEAAANGLQGAGALGPVDAFGLRALRAGVESCGVRVLG
ncbi:MAG TPA: saccharopine dehydrogenase, partial [Actinomycetota bacterium]|nr:saccharopine dehydrogenase [Actinomycetota bacterium]